MGVIWGGHGAGIDVLAHLVEHLAEVGKLLGLRPFLSRTTAAIEIAITKRNHLTNLAGTANVAATFTTHTDASHGDAFIGAKHARR